MGVNRMATVLAAVWLTACGGGGSGGTSEPPASQPRANVAGLNCTGADSSGWCWQAPQPSGHWIEAVAFTSASDGWAVGDGGLLLRTRDGGASWEQRALPGAPLLVGVSFAPDGRQGWLLGSEGGLMWRTTDGGDTWTAAPGLPLLSASSLRRADSGALMVQGLAQRQAAWQESVVLVSDDAGATWREGGVGLLAIDADGTRWRWVKPQDRGVTLMSSIDGGLSYARPAPAGWPAEGEASAWQTAPGGYAWVTLTTSRPTGVELATLARLGNGQAWARVEPPPNILWPLWFDALGRWGASRPGLWHADAAGEPWKAVKEPAPSSDGRFWSYDFIDGQTAWTHEDWPSPVAWLTTDAAGSWTRLPDLGTGGDRAPVQLWRDGGGGLLMAAEGAAGPNERARAWLRSPDQGRHWHPVPMAQQAGLAAVGALWMLNGQRGLGLTAPGVLLETDDGGGHWRRADTSLPPSDPSLPGLSMQFTPDGTGWVLNGGRLYRSDDAGRSWMVQGLPVAGDDVRGIQFVDARTAFLRLDSPCPPGYGTAPCGPRLMVTDDGAQSWRLAGLLPQDGQVHMLDRRRGVCVGDTGAVVTHDGGATWGGTALPGNPDVNAPTRLARGTGALWLLRGDQLLRSADAGASWAQVDLPQPRTWGIGWRSASGGDRHLNDLHFAPDGMGWIVGDGGLVLASTDGGATWQRQATGTSTNVTSVFALGPQAVWIGGDRGTVLASATGGR